VRKLTHAFVPNRVTGLGPAPEKKQVISFFFHVFILWIYIYIYMFEKKQIFFSCVLYTANTLTCLERFYKKKIFEVLKMCFRMDFLNTKQKLFSCILDFTMESPWISILINLV